MVYVRENYELNKEAFKAAQKRYYLKNREQRLTNQKEYNELHKEELAQRRK
ncbi:hypothetical protein PHYSODRAFT_459019, partial [Phytophthora sojae]